MMIKVRNKKALSALIALFMLLNILMPSMSAYAAEPETLAGWNWSFSASTPLSLPIAATNGTLQASGTLTNSMAANPTGSTNGTIYNASWDNGADTKYWLFSLSTTGYENLTFSAKAYSTNSGPRDFKLQYSINNGGSWNEIANSSRQLTNALPSALTWDKLSIPADAGNLGNLLLRLIMISNTSVSGSTINASSGNSRLAVVNIDGTVIGALPSVSNVTAAPSGGVITDGTPLTLSTSTTDAAIYYSIYSPADTLLDSGTYTAPLTLNFNVNADPITVKAYASADGMDDSTESSWTFTQAKLANVIAAPIGGEVAADTPVTLSAASGADIYYTTNGDTPSTDSTEYTGEITIPSLPYTIKAIAVKAGYLNSDVAAFSYTAASQQTYSPDGENGTAVEWNLSSPGAGVNFTQPIAATGGDMISGSGLTCWFGAAQPTLNFGSNGANCSGWDNGLDTKYWMIQTSTRGMSDLSLSWRMRSSSSGPRDFKVQYSTDGGTWADVPNSAIKVPSAGSLADAANLFTVALPNAAFNKANVWLKWIMTSNVSAGGSTVGSSGTHQINNIAITGAYLIGDNQAYAATADIADNKVPLNSVVTFSSRTSGADIKFSTDGGNVYTTADNGQVTLTALPATLLIKAVKEGLEDSRVKAFSFTQAKVASITPSPKAGAVPSNGTITLTTEPADASIKYILTAKAGTAEETILPEADYTAPIALSEDMFPLKITARGIKTNYIDSDSISFNYTARKPSGGEKNYFGQIHSHTTNSDGAGTLDEAFTWARDNANLDFFAVTDHSNSFDTAPAGDKAGTYNLGDYNKNNIKWQNGKTAAANAAVPGEYVSFYAYEMTWSGGPGHMNTFNTEGFVSRNNTELNSKTNDAGLRAYYDLLKLHPESVSQFNHPGTTFGNFSNFSYYDPVIDERITLIEVGNGEGAIGSGGYFPSYDQYNMALDKGWHVAPTNNQDNHKALWGNSNTARTVIYTNDFTTEGIYQAMKDMRVYATEDVNLDIVYTLNNEQLGTILETVPATANFKVDAKNIAGSNKVKSIAIITNGGVEAYKENFGTTDAALNYSMENPKAGYYYIKVVQEDGRIAVTAPVWLGKADNVGISGLTASSSTPVTTEEITLTTEVFNNEASVATLNSVNYQIKGGNVIADNTLNTPIAASSTVKHTQSFTPTEAKKTTIIVTVSVRINGVDKTYTKEIELNVTDITKLNFIGIDASHLNEYVAGNYKDGMKNFSTIAMQYGLRTVMLNTSEDLIAAAANPKYQMFILTAPTRRLDPASGITHKFYSNEELTAIADFANQGKPVIITGWGDYYESYAYVTPGLENHMAGQQNKLLAAIGSTLRVSDDEAKDDVTNGGTNPRLYLDDHNGEVSPLLAGLLDGQKFSQYGGSTVYAVNPDGTPAAALPASVTPIISGHSTTYSSDDDHDGYGFTDIAIKIPRYGSSPDAGKGVGKVLLAASETVNHGNGITSQVIVAGGAFMSDFEIKNTALDNPADAYSNEVILRNLLSSIENITITPIADVKTAEEGTEFTIEGIATVSVYDGSSASNTGFFDSIYVQDATGGINLFPVSSGVQAGQKIRVTGVLSAYQGEKQLNVSSVKILDSTINPVEPTVVTTGDAMAPDNTGKLLTLTGKVKRVVAEPNGTINEITIDDGTGEAIIYINAYITPNESLSFVRVGAAITVTGLGSIGENFTSTTDFLPRIRVRDRGEIELVNNSTLSIGSENTGGVGRTREITIGGIDSLELEGKYLVVQFTEGTGVNAKVSVLMISPSNTTVTVSYQSTVTEVEAWLTDGIPNLTGEDMSVTVYAYANTNN